MGRYMISCCCVCGRAAAQWHDPEWEAAGGKQDFCPEHSQAEMVQYPAGPGEQKIKGAKTMKRLTAEKCSDGWLVLVEETYHLHSEDEVRTFARQHGLDNIAGDDKKITAH